MKPLQIEGTRALAGNGSIHHVGVKTETHADFDYVDKRGHRRQTRYTVTINQMWLVSNRHLEPRYFYKTDTMLDWLRKVGISSIDGFLL